MISAIEKDLTSAGTDTSRRFFRYFTLTNLYNAGDAKLATYRSALSKLVNSLSWDKDITLPAIIDKEQTILRIDIREYDWTDPARNVGNNPGQVILTALSFRVRPMPAFRR